MTCPACGTPTVPGARFCFACGIQLPASSVSDAGTERRVVTVLFGDLSDFTSWSEDLDPERVGVVTDRVLATLAAAVAEFGGSVDKLTGDGLMAVFGAPTAHEDDAERAVRAAARMQSAVRRVVQEESGGGRRLGLRVGLNTGEVVAGVQASLSYTVIGDTVNTAARLSDAAGVGAVFAGRETAVATTYAASWRALTPLRLKGKREPVVAYELVGLRSSSASRLGLGDEVPMIGRDAELGLLVGRLLEVSDRDQPRSVLVSGDAGVGKTRLAQELARFHGELPGARVLWGRCTPYGEGRDLSAVADMVRTACGIDDTDDPDTARERLARTVARLEHPACVGTVPPAMGERLRILLGLEVEPVVASREAVTPGAAAGGDLVRAAVAALFTALAADGPLLLVLDDVHWATPIMLDGVLDVAGQTKGRVLMLLVGRPDMLELVARGGDGPWWRGLPDVELLPVLPLEESAIERLLRAYLGTPTDDLDVAVRSALLSRAQGNPFFLAELLNLLVDRGALVRSGDRWTLRGDLPEGVLPAGVQAVLAARIDRLDGATKGVLRDASVLGVQVTAAGLVAVGRASGHGDPEVVRAAVDELVDRRLLEAGGPTPEDDGTYRFSHTLVRDVAYAGLAKAERARRHAAAAAWAAGLHESAGGSARSADVDGVTALQGERAVQLAAEMGLARTDPSWRGRDLAFAALLRMGTTALARDEAEPAESLLRRALALAAPELGPALDATDLALTSVRHAQALARLRRLTEAEDEVRPVLDDADGALRAAALIVLGEVRRKRGETDAARQALVSALSTASDAGADRLTAEALRELGLLDHVDGRLRDAEERFRQAYALAVQVDDVRSAGWSLQHLAWSATTRGDYELATAVLEQAAETFAGLGDTGGLSWIAGTEGYVRLLRGELLQARELAQSVLPLGETAGERWGVAVLLTIDAMAAAELGDVAAAAAQAARAGQRFEELGDCWGQALALIAGGAAARGADRPDRAVELLAQAVRLAEEGGFPLVRSLALVSSGYASLELGDLDGAERAASCATAALAGLDLEPHALLGAQVLLAQVLRARGQLVEALETLDQALAGAPIPALLFPRRQALAHRAGILLQLGRTEHALVAAREAVATPAQDVRAQVLAHRALGSALRASGDEPGARQAFAEALRTARATGQKSEVATTEQLLAASPG